MTHHHPATACLLQELCEGNLGSYLHVVNPIMYDSLGQVSLPALAPLLMDICKGMLYLHARNIVHGGR